MRHKILILLMLPLVLIPLGAYTQQVAQGLRGNWTLDVPKSSFGPDGPPSAGTIRWTQHGWALALIFPAGYVYTDAVITDHGCALIGVPDDYTCRIDILAPTHIRFTLKQAATVRRVGDIELIDKNTTRTVHRVTPPSKSAYVETTIWIRDAN